MDTPPYRPLRFGTDRVTALARLPVEWVARAWDEAGLAERRGIFELAMPGGLLAVIKVYRPRPRHGLWRRFRTSRAIREGRGYRAFRARGVRTPLLLFYGERRRAGLWELGAVATLRVDAIPVDEAFARDRDDEMLHCAASVLADVHRAELAHGDPRLRNFLATRPRPMPFDLPSWGRLTGPAQERDLSRFLGSSAVLTKDPAFTASLLERYLRTGPKPGLERQAILDAAARYAEEKGIP